MVNVKKLSKISLAIFLSCNIVLTNVPLGVRADNIENGNVVASIENNKITMSNDYINREFSINENKVSTSLIENKRANTNIVPKKGSEDFIINTIQSETVEKLPEQTVVLPSMKLDRTNWKATLTASNGSTFVETQVKKLFDDNPSTNVDNYLISGYPISLEIDLGEVKEISSFSYLKRPGYSDKAYGVNGTMGKYKLYVSDDKVQWKEAGSGEFTRENYNLHQVNTIYNVGDVAYGNFDKTYKTRYVKIEQLSDALGNTSEFTAAEINLFSDKYKLPEILTNDTKIKSSSLTIDNETTKIEDIENGKKLTISYMPYTLNKIEYDIDMIVILEKDDHYMRSFIEIKTNNNNAKIDYIEMDSFALSDDIMNTVWSHPDLSNVSSMWIGKNELMLGQPIYANGMFFGSEFPATDTDVVNGKMQIRYYSGKSFERLSKDNQLTTDSKFVSWQNVIGAAKGTNTDVVQTDFFEYISNIATPTDFRKQYNSWYDNMMGISDESIAKSFYGSEKGLTANGIEPVDSYVVDDGWNNYRDTEFNSNIGADAAGNSMNRTGFWEFNDKFPNELYTSTGLAEKFQSKFGLWLGPQGGYNFFGNFANYLEKMGTGYKQTGYWTNVCVGSEKYVENLTELFVDYQTRFDVDYWKIDGFAVRPCTNDKHDHMTGGTNNMYYTTDLWENWIDAWVKMRENREAEGKELFINATCYVNLSPWLLQWVNTVWVQDSGDTGQAGTGARYQQKITYRDNVYYNLLKKNQVQFPLKNIYNHDPIYGVSDGSSSTTEDFRDFLFENAARGTAFWELYYSPSIMNDEKWKVNADALDFAERNSHILENAKFFGNVPTQGVYGYSSWDGNEGIISFRNPTGEEQNYTLELSEVIGVPKSVSNLRGNQVLPYVAGEAGSISYGDTIKVTLKPYETRIIQYGNTDKEGAKIISSKVTGDKEITIKYNERVKNIKNAYSIEGNTITDTILLDDYRTIVIKTENILLDNVSLNINGEIDSLGNSTTDLLNIPVYKDSNILLVKSNEDLVEAESLNKTYNGNLDMFFTEINKPYKAYTSNSFEGTTDFAINMTVKTTGSEVNLFKQGDDISLSIDNEGYINFKVKDITVNSKANVTTVIEKAHGTFGTNEYVPTSITTTEVGKINDGEIHQVVAVREVNGMIKIYIDGELANSFYDSSKINQSINKDEIVIGDNNFKGHLGTIEFKNSSIYYDEVKLNYSLYEKESIIEYNREGWMAEACSEMSGSSGDASASAAIDGNANSWWHTNYVGGDNHQGSHWISIDFGEEINLDTIKLLQRGSGSNGTIKQYKLEAKINDQWKNVKEDTFTDGVNSIIELDKSINASGIKITSISTFNGKNFAAIKEINVSQKDRLADTNEISDAIKLIKEIEENNYTVATVKKYKEVVSKINNVDSIYTNALNSLKQEMQSAYNSLLEAKDLNSILLKVDSLNKDDYTEGSWKALISELLKAKSIVENINSTKEDIASSKLKLEEVIDDLVDISEINKILESTNTIAESEYTKASYNEFLNAKVELEELLLRDDVNEEALEVVKVNLINKIKQLVKIADKSELNNKVSDAKKLVEADYTAESFNRLKVSLEAANEVLKDEEVSQEQVNKALFILQDAIKDLVKSTAEKPINLIEVDKSDLEDIINKANSLKKDKYTEDTWRNFQDSLEKGKEVLNNKEASEEEVNLAISNIDNAIKNLKEQDNKNNSSNNRSNSSNGSNSSNTGNSGNSSNSSNGGNRSDTGNIGNSNNKDSKNNNSSNKNDEKLPSTGGIAASSIALFGALTTVLGAFIIKKKDK